MVELLIEHKVEVNNEDIYGQTPLFNCFKSNIEVFDLLVTQEGIDWNKQDINGNTLLHKIATINDKKLVSVARTLLSMSSDLINIKNKQGRTVSRIISNVT